MINQTLRQFPRVGMGDGPVQNRIMQDDQDGAMRTTVIIDVMLFEKALEVANS